MDDFYKTLYYENIKKVPLRFSRYFQGDKLMADYLNVENSDVENIRNIFKTVFMILKFINIWVINLGILIDFLFILSFFHFKKFLVL